MKKCKLLITDLDGTLIETVSGDTFPKGIWDMKIKLDVFEAIKNYAPDDILIISNQGGIEKGFVDKEMFEYKFDYISNALEDYTDVSVSAYYCESNNKRNVNRKPNIGMIKEYMDFIEDMNNDEDEEEKYLPHHEIHFYIHQIPFFLFLLLNIPYKTQKSYTQS